MKSFLGSRSSKKLQRKCGQCNRKACRDEDRGVEPCDICKLQDWLRNYKLAKTDAFSLFNEFLEMGKSTVMTWYEYSSHCFADQGDLTISLHARFCYRAFGYPSVTARNLGIVV